MKMVGPHSIISEVQGNFPLASKTFLHPSVQFSGQFTPHPWVQSSVENPVRFFSAAQGPGLEPTFAVEAGGLVNQQTPVGFPPTGVYFMDDAGEAWPQPRAPPTAVSRACKGSTETAGMGPCRSPAAAGSGGRGGEEPWEASRLWVAGGEVPGKNPGHSLRPLFSFNALPPLSFPSFFHSCIFARFAAYGRRQGHRPQARVLPVKKGGGSDPASQTTRIKKL